MKTLDELLEDRDAIAAVQTLVAHGFSPDVAAEAVMYFAAHGTRRRSERERACDVMRAAGLDPEA